MFEERLEAGQAAYRAGDRARAEKLAAEVLAIDRRHACANWLAGNICHDRGKLDRAISHYRRALRADPALAEAHNDLGTAYHSKGWYAEAEQCFREALRLRSELTAAVENLAAALRAQGKIKEARNAYLRVLRLRLRSGFDRLFRRVPRAPIQSTPAPQRAATAVSPTAEALARYRAGDHAAVQSLLAAHLASGAEDAQAEYLLGLSLVARRKGREALAHLERCVALRSSVPEYHVALGNLLADSQQFARAIDCYRVALALDPEHAPATANIAKVLHDLGHFGAAEAGFRASLEQDSSYAPVHANLAGVLVTLARLDDAEVAARRAVALDPGLVHASVTLARVLGEQGRYQAGQQVLDEVCARAPRDPDVLRELAEFALRHRADFGEARGYLERALAVAPDSANTHFSYAQVLLHQREFPQGWKHYEWRKRVPSRIKVFATLPYPDWDGASLKGKRIVVNAEQGLGDEVMFASCLRELARDAARCALLCSRRLEPLFRRSFGGIEIVPGSHIGSEDPFPVPQEFDVQVAAGSLPGFFRRIESDFPRHVGYLRTDETKVAAWRERVRALGPGLKVGISWRGGSSLTGYFRRSLVLENLADLLQVPGVRWVSLQYGRAGEETGNASRSLGIPIAHWQQAVDDLDETAALISALDLRISVCNTQAHLCGALGKEVWVLAPRVPDWRYGNVGESMDWYPAARIFRQQTPGDWRGPTERLRAALLEKVGMRFNVWKHAYPGMFDRQR